MTRLYHPGVYMILGWGMGGAGDSLGASAGENRLTPRLKAPEWLPEAGMTTSSERSAGRAAEPPSTAKRSALRRFFSALGPGLITGAADDDPSGVATYSVAGAQLGTSLLWTAALTWPLMAAVQMMCARIGMVSGYGLAEALREKFPRPLVAFATIALLAANTVNIGA